MMGLIGMGNNPMVGATVAVAVSVAQALAKHRFIRHSQTCLFFIFYLQ